MAKGTIAQLSEAIAKVSSEREAHVAALARIDATFAQLGLAPAPVKRGPGRPKGSTTKKVTKKKKAAAKKAPAKKAPKKKAKKAAAKPAAPKKKRGKRGSYELTASQFVLSLVTSGKSLSTSDIIGLWKKAGRGGKPDNALTQLVADKKLKRAKVKNGRGNTYTKA